MKRILILLLCAILCIPLSYSQHERVTLHIDNDSTHLYTFGVYRDNIPSDTWYYFGKYGQLIKSRSGFKSVGTVEGTYYSCLESSYAVNGDTLSSRVVRVESQDLRHRPSGWNTITYTNEALAHLNRVNKYHAKDGLWDSGYYVNGEKFGLHYYISGFTGQLSALSEYANNQLTGNQYVLKNNKLLYLISKIHRVDTDLSAAYLRKYHPNGIIESKGDIVFYEDFEIDGEYSGIWIYYNESGDVVKTDTFPDRTTPDEQIEVDVKRLAVAKNYHGKKHPYASVYLTPVEKTITTRYPEDIWKVRVVKLQSLGVKAVQVDPDTDSKYIAICEDKGMIAFVDSTTSTKRKLQGYGNKYGLITLDDQITPVGYYYKAQWSENPTIYLGAYPTKKAHLVKMQGQIPHQWNYQQGEDITVVAYTNTEEAELCLNGEVVGEKKKNTSSHTIEWIIPYQPGDLKVCGYQDGAVVHTDSIYTPGKPHSISFEEIRLTTKDYCERNTLQVIVKVLDKNERLVYTSDRDFLCGDFDNLRILGIDNGQENNYHTDSLHTFRVHGGTAKVYLEMIDRWHGGKVFVASKPLIGSGVYYAHFF